MASWRWWQAAEGKDKVIPANGGQRRQCRHAAHAIILLAWGLHAAIIQAGGRHATILYTKGRHAAILRAWDRHAFCAAAGSQ